MRTVLLTEPIHKDGMALLEAHHRVIVAINSTEDSLVKQVAEAEALIVRLARVTQRVLQAGRNLKVVVRHGVGVDNVDVVAATQLGIPVCSVPNANSMSVVEHVIIAVGMLMKGIARYDRDLRCKAYEDVRQSIVGQDLAGKTLGIIGLGRIGLEVARRCHSAFDMRVIGYDPYVSTEAARGVEIVSCQKQVLERADVLSIHVPLTTTTRGMIGSKELAIMKTGAFLINTSRGEVVDEEALIRNLHRGHLAGAALDVFSREPIPQGHPLFDLPNVILTPHIAGVTRDSLARLSIGAAQAVIHALAGKRPEHVVNPEVFTEHGGTNNE